MVDQQVHQFLQGHLQALLEPLSSDVALEVQEALRKASESDVDTLEWVGRMIQQLCHPDFQELLTALRERLCGAQDNWPTFIRVWLHGLWSGVYDAL